jgi:hypothetical protein
MPLYIVCQKKRNNPRMDTRICQRKCNLKNECKEYLSVHQTIEHQTENLFVRKVQSVSLEAA